MSRTKKNNPGALHIQPGVEPPPQVSNDAVRRIQFSRKKALTVDELYEGLRRGDRIILSKAITLAESSLYHDQKVAQTLIERCLPDSGMSLRVGVTGVPGVGKSTFIEALGKHLTSQGMKLGVLAIDPSSSRSKGSILGDKTRMEELAADPDAFIRPSPSAGSLGGVARKTWETIILCEAAGFDVIFVETVGVGQSETAVHAMTDFFLLLMLAGAGDELQGIKRGIMEMADAIVINKADGDNIRKARAAATEYRNALSLFPSAASGLEPPVVCCSALERSGIPEIWDHISLYIAHVRKTGYFQAKRKEQDKVRMYHCIEDQLKSDFFHSEKIAGRLSELEKDVLENRISAYVAAQRLLDLYISRTTDELPAGNKG
jgi:LAO/AO transport system kinase